GSSRSSATTARLWAAKASLISQRPTSGIDQLARSRALRLAGIGPSPMTWGQRRQGPRSDAATASGSVPVGCTPARAGAAPAVASASTRTIGEGSLPCPAYRSVLCVHFAREPCAELVETAKGGASRREQEHIGSIAHESSRRRQ